MTADKAYDSEKVRQQIADDGALPVIPSRSNATKKSDVKNPSDREIKRVFRYWLL